MANLIRYASTVLLAAFLFCGGRASAADGAANDRSEGPLQTETDATAAWQARAADYAKIMSQVKWTPVAEGMPRQWARGLFFEQGTEYTGVPYSNQSHEGRNYGRTIGFEIFLKTFLAAVENPHSVLYTEKIPERRRGRDGYKSYYGKVCSSFTSYALQCGFQFIARQHDPHAGGGGRHPREGIIRVDPQSAQAAAVGDLIQHPGHTEIVTGITRDAEGIVTHVRVEDSRPPTVRTYNRDAANFDRHITSGGRALYHITDLDAWRGNNRAETFRFPDYEADTATPDINRVLLLCHGDWIPYFRGQTVRINVMDRDGRGVRTLVIRRGNTVVEEIALEGTGIIERAFDVCGDYTAQVVMRDGSLSPACEFAVCDLEFRPAVTEVTRNDTWDIEFNACNMDAVYVNLRSSANEHGIYQVVIDDRNRERGRVTIPAGLLQAEDTGALRLRLFGENRYGRLHRQTAITVVE